MSEHRDPVISRALGRVHVPDHGPDFWAELDARLDVEDGAAGETLTALRLRRRWFDQRNLVVAAAAALVIVLGAALLLSTDRTDTKSVNAGDGDPAPTTAVVPTTDAPGAAATPGARTRPTPDGAVNDWLEALGRGDEQAAAALVGPKSRRYIESLGGNVEGMMRESEEGYGAWGASPDRTSTEIDLGVIDGSPTTIVVVTGTWRGEGQQAFRTDAIPSVKIGNGWKVEPMAFDPDSGGRLEVTSPTRRDDGAEFSPLPPDGVFSANAPGSGNFYFSLEDNEPVQVAGTRSGGGAQATWDPPGEMGEQTHLFVVAYVDGDTLTAFAGRVRVSS